jgi:hypothetical protein
VSDQQPPPPRHLALPLGAVIEVRSDDDGRPVLVVRSEAPADDDRADNDGA